MKKAMVSLLIGVFFISQFLLGEKKQDPAPRRVIAVSVWAENIAETAEFYQKLLELTEPPVRQNGRMRLRMDGAVLFIIRGRPCKTESEAAFPLFAFAVSDLDKAEAFLRARNIKMPYGIEGSGQHRELQFHDPAGNLVELVQNR